MRTTRLQAGAVLCAAAVLVLTGCKRTTYDAPDQLVDSAKRLSIDIRRMFESGRLALQKEDPGAGGPGDGRLSLLGIVVEKVGYNVAKREKNEARKKAAQAKIDEFFKTFGELAEKYQPAVDEGKNEVSKELVPYMQTLETRLDELQAILQGKTPKS